MKHSLGIVFLITLLLSACSAVPTSAPQFINHSKPKVNLDITPFEKVGCASNQYQFRVCEKHSPLYALGCDFVEAPSSILGALEPAYPIVLCKTGYRGANDEIETANELSKIEGHSGYYIYSPAGKYFFIKGSLAPFLYRYVMVQDNQFVLIETEDEFRQIFAPLESADEALAYVTAATGLLDLYDLRYESNLEYFVNVIEDTHAEEASDGYVVNLFVEDLRCSIATTEVKFHVTHDGHITQRRGNSLVFKERLRNGECLVE